MDVPRRNLVDSYSIPKQLENQLQRENQEDLEVSNDSIRNDILRNEYQDRRYKRHINLNFDEVQSYRDIMEERGLERQQLEIKEKSEHENQFKNSERRTKRRRWDVTPEERKLIISKENESSNPTDSTELVGFNDTTITPTVNGIELTDSVLDLILPAGYIPIYPNENQKRKFNNSLQSLSNYYVPPSAELSSVQSKRDLEQSLPSSVPGVSGIDHIKEKDVKYFSDLFSTSDNMSSGEQEKKIEVMKLLLKIKNGVPSARKKSMRQLTQNAQHFGSKIIFSQVLPLLLEPTLDIQERHILVKLMGKVIFQLDTLVRPYTSKILSVISPLLIDEDFTLRLEARDIVSNLAKAAGLANLVSSLRPDLDHADEYVRNLCSRVFAIVANTMGLMQFLPFLKAVIKSRKNWMIRHTGIKIIQQLGILLGGGNGTSILPYLSEIVTIVTPGLSDEVLQVRVLSALTIAQLADNVKPYGIETFEIALEPTLYGFKKHRGKSLASFLKCMGAIIPLMFHAPSYEEYANYYSKELINVISREFNSPDDDMKKTILKILANLPLSKDLIKNYETLIIGPFFKSFWNRRTSSGSKQIIRFVNEATSSLAVSFDFYDVLERLVVFSKDENEFLRIMCLEAISKMLSAYPDAGLGLDSALEVRLVDGVLFSFQEQSIPSKAYLNSFNCLATTLNKRLSPHLNSIISTILYRLKNKSPEVRQQASDLIVIMAPIISQCSNGDDSLLEKLILILYESLGEIYPEVLGSLLNALRSCIDNVDKMTLYTMKNPSINQILPTLTPVLKNRNEKVQESCIKLVGLIACKNAETINAKEWMRICFELLEMLKINKKRIRVAANDTFGYIAKTIGPQDVIVMLLNNLRVQERQLRVCTSVAIGIVAETCLPFTVLPALMNEYRVPENNVQNGILKALSFLFEYIEGFMARDYIFAVTPLLEDALTDRDLVHRQTAASVIKHMAMNCIGCSDDTYYDVFMYYLNLLMPNLYETSPHVINRILESLDSLRIILGIGCFSNYIWAGLFHPARKVRTPYWKLFNSAYVFNSDSIVPYYPDLSGLHGGEYDYSVAELDLFL